MLKVGVIFGGMSAEKEPSLSSGRYVYSLLDPEKYEGIPLFWHEDGTFWHIPDKLVIKNKTSDIVENLEKEAEIVPFEALSNLIDVAFLALHGKFGEDGVIQGLLELLRIPYTGSGILASAIAADKNFQRPLLAAYDIKMPKICAFRDDVFSQRSLDEVWEEIKGSLGLPVVVKPTREGSSIGVKVLDQKDELEHSFKQAFQWDREVIVEEFIKGLEFVCTTWGNKEDSIETMPPTEIEFPSVQNMHTYESKYMPGKTNYYTPPRVSKDLVAKIRKTVKKTYAALGMVDYSRIDGFLAEEEVYIVDVHTSSFLTPSSFVFHQAAQTKIPSKVGGKFDATKFHVDEEDSLVQVTPRMFVTKIIQLALENHENKTGALLFEHRGLI